MQHTTALMLAEHRLLGAQGGAGPAHGRGFWIGLRAEG